MGNFFLSEAYTLAQSSASEGGVPVHPYSVRAYLDIYTVLAAYTVIPGRLLYCLQSAIYTAQNLSEFILCQSLSIPHHFKIDPLNPFPFFLSSPFARLY